MHQKDDVIEKLKNWVLENNAVRAMVLTGSRANPDACVDDFSDYDIALYVEDMRQFMNDEWLKIFGNVMIRWPLKPMPTLNKDWITRLILFENRIRIDFQITAGKELDPSSYDDGYKVLVDKDGLTKNLTKPTFSKFKIKKPSREEFENLVNAFFWNTTYVAKNLSRDELYYARYMLDNVLRFDDLQKMIEWYITMQHDWSISTGKCGRLFKHYLSPEIWKRLEKTYSDACIENNWQSLFDMIDLFRNLGKAVADNLKFEYPDKVDKQITAYCRKIQASKSCNHP